MDIKTKAQLIEALSSHPVARLHGHFGARPSSPWKYTLRVPCQNDKTVSSTAVNAAMSELFCLRHDWMISKYRLKNKSEK